MRIPIDIIAVHINEFKRPFVFLLQQFCSSSSKYMYVYTKKKYINKKYCSIRTNKHKRKRNGKNQRERERNLLAGILY